MNSNVLLIISLALVLSVHSRLSRRKRAPFQLPAGAEKIVGQNIDTSFKCPGDGYYADVQNDCKLFHRCLTHNKSGGQSELLHETFMCGNKTIWDQSSFACRHEDDAIPCSASEMFFDLNERIGSDGPFLDERDIERSKNARPDFRARK